VKRCLFSGEEFVLSMVTINSSLQPFSNRSSDAKYLAVSSRDGYCTLIEFENDELGQPHILAGIYIHSLSCTLCTMNMDFSISHSS
jgi:hypothetical protein